MKTHQDYTDYFEQIAKQHKELQHHKDGNLTDVHFYRVNKWEFKNALSVASSPMLILSPKLSRSIGGMANKSKQHQGSFSVLKAVSSSDNYKEQDEVQTYCEQIALDIEQKLIKDKRDQLFRGLDLESFNIQPEGPIEGIYYGVHMSFTWTTSDPVSYDESKWINETTG